MIVRMAPSTKAFYLASWEAARHEAGMRSADSWAKNIRALGPRPTLSRGQALREDDGQGSWSLLNACQRPARHKIAE